MRPKATIEQHQTKRSQWRAVAGLLVVSAWGDYEFARHLAAAWNACRDIETEKLETLALSKNLLESGKV